MDAKTDASTKQGQLTIGNQNWSFPIYDGTIGPSVMDISKLYNQAEYIHVRPGLYLDRELRVQDHLHRW